MPFIDPRESSEFIASVAGHVTINDEGTLKLAQQLVASFADDSYSTANWKKHPLHPQVADDDAIEWIFVLDSLNFSFWTADDGPKFEIELDGEKFTGYWALAAAILNAKKDGCNITNPEVYGAIGEEELRHIFKSSTSATIPLFEERLRILHENSSILKTNFAGKFKNVVIRANGSARKLLQLVVDNFPSFRDECDFMGCRVSFYKRAQILVADIWACFEGKELGHFDDIDCLTMFADYRVPQILNYFNVLNYDDIVKEILLSKKELPFGHPIEVEIRGLSIQAIEVIKKKMNIDKINSAILDFYLWDLRRKKSDEIDRNGLPFHRIRSIYY